MFASLNNVFIQSIANNVLSDETSLSNDDYVKKTAIKLIERHVDAPFISVLALASVVESPIKLCTKDIVDARQMKLFNSHIDPRESVEIGNTVFLFWTLSNDRSETKLNHYAQLINSKSCLVLKFIKRTTLVRKESIITKPLIESVFFKIDMKRTMQDSTKSNDIKRSNVVSSLTRTSESICSKKLIFISNLNVIRMFHLFQLFKYLCINRYYVMMNTILVIIILLQRQITTFHS